MENNVESVDLIQTQILGLKELAQMVAVIDTAASRGTFKAEEFSTIGRLREIIIAESQAQAQIRQAAQQETESLDAVSYTHLRAHETLRHLVCRLLLEKKK